jgi:hypothetical protein
MEMLNRNLTRITRTYEIDVLSTDTIAEAGLALTSVIENGKAKARRSNGVDNTIFLGVSWGDYLGVGTTVTRNVQALPGAAGSAGAGLTLVALPATVTGTADMVVIPGTAYGAATPLIPHATTADATHYVLAADSRSITVTDAVAAANPNGFFIAFRYAPTAAELTNQYGDMFYPTAANQMKRIGIIRDGEVWTNSYDTAVDWSAIDTLATAEVIRAGTNGRFTVNVAGALCRNTFVIGVPTAMSPWLGLRVEN